MQGSAQPKQGSDLAESGLWLKVAIFIEKRFLGLIELPQHGPIDLATQESLRVEVAAPSPSRSLQLADWHAILVQDAELEFVDDGAFRRVRLVHC